eukprot:gene17621-19375_t
MSEDMEKEVPIAARRTESLDAPNILKLVSNETNEIFGRINIVQLIEKSNLAISLVDEKNEILGHAAFLDYPPGKYADQSNWETWLKSCHDINQLTPVNTLFLHYFVSMPDFSHGSLCEILRTLFNAVPLLNNVILVIPNDVSISGGLSKVFEPLKCKDGIDAASQIHKSFICYRHKHCPVLYIRSARVEDHDDLMPIFDKHNTELTAMYGDFFLSDLIEAEDDNNKSIVADVDGTSFGFMSLCTDVNLDILNKCFELEPFNGLKSMPRKDQVKNNVEETKVTKLPATKSRPESKSVTIKTDDTSSVLSSPDPKARPLDTPATPQSSLSTAPVDKQARSPIAKGSFHRSKLKSASKTPSQASVPVQEKSPPKAERPSTPVKEEAKHEEEQRPESEMTIKLEKEDNKETEKQGGEDAEEEKLENEADLIESAVCIQLFCIDEKFETRSMDFLPKVFEMFPEKDYCIITIPHTVPEFPLLQTFKRATPKAASTISQELYVFHRNGLLSSINVRECREKDTKAIEKLVKTVVGKEHLLRDVQQFIDARRDQDGTEIKCYIAECMEQIIGVSVIRQEEDVEYIRAHYNIEDFVYFNHHEREEHGHLHHFALNPAFSHYSKHFLKEILRLSHKSCLYYPLYQSMPSSEFSKPHSLATCLSELVPIRPRRQIIYPVDKLGVNAPSKRVLKHQECYSLYHMNRKLTLEPKVVINVRIVIVGASDVGLSCLDALLVNCPHLCFNNLTLVSENGLQLNDDMSLLSKSLCFSQKEMDAMSLPTWISIVAGKMTKIDRVNKNVVINNERHIPYDHLLLCTGQQFQYPVPTGVDITTLATTSEALLKKLPKVYKGFLPSGVIRLNHESELNAALKWVKEDSHSSKGALVVYGATLEAYAFIQTLLNNGVSGERIELVKPPIEKPSCFNNPHVERTIEDAMIMKGIVVHNEYTLAQWNDGERNDELTCSTFTSNTKPLRIECQGFFCFQEKRVDYQAFKAINDSCLVYDGKLVIDSNFRTNDPFIKAAGSITKYARKYHVDAWTHAIYNSREVGVRLAESILSMFDPTLEEPMNESLLDDKLIPVYRKPKMAFAVLPGGYNYLHIGKASLPSPLGEQMAQPTYGQVLETQSADSSKYFRLHLNQYNAVETITCLSVEPMDIENLICLFGIHERYLNNLVQRYEEGLIEDLFSYFKDSWCLAIFHDRFGDFRAEIHEILAEREVEDALSLEEKVRKLIDEDLVLSKEQRDYLTDSYTTSNAKKLLKINKLGQAILQCWKSAKRRKLHFSYFNHSFWTRKRNTIHGMSKKNKSRHCEFWNFTLPSDLVLSVESRELHVHKEILCHHSPVFKVMLESDFLEKKMEKIPLPGKTVSQVLEMLNFIYPFGHEVNDTTDIYNLLDLSREYQIDKIKTQCEVFLKRKPASLDLLITAQEYDLFMVREKCLKYLSSRALAGLQDHPKFEMLSEENKIKIMQVQLQHLQQYCKKVWKIASTADPRYIPMILPTCNHRPKGCNTPHFFCNSCKASVLKSYVRNESWRMGFDPKNP